MKKEEGRSPEPLQSAALALPFQHTASMSDPLNPELFLKTQNNRLSSAHSPATLYPHGYRPPALSIRQPWAWLVMMGYKDVENRTWYTHYRGEFLIHAAKGMTQEEYEVCLYIAQKNGVSIPAKNDLVRGAIIGSVELHKCVHQCLNKSESPWFFGPYGFVLRNAQAFTSPIPYKGAQGFFRVTL